MLSWIIVAAVVVAVLALGWWSSGRKSSALKIDGAQQSIDNGNAQFEHFRNQHGPGSPGGFSGSAF